MKRNRDPTEGPRNSNHKIFNPHSSPISTSREQASTPGQMVLMNHNRNKTRPCLLSPLLPPGGRNFGAFPHNHKPRALISSPWNSSSSLDLPGLSYKNSSLRTLLSSPKHLFRRRENAGNLLTQSFLTACMQLKSQTHLKKKGKPFSATLAPENPQECFFYIVRNTSIQI